MKTAFWLALLAVAPGFCLAAGDFEPGQAAAQVSQQQQQQQPPPNSTKPKDATDKPEKMVAQPPMPPKAGEVPPGPSTSPKSEAGLPGADPLKMAGAPGTDSKLPAGAAVDAKSYIIGAEDVIGISVWDNGQLSGSFSVRPDGKISMPLIGEIEASGKTPEQLKSEVTEALKNGYVVSPMVNVSVLQVLSKKYYINGEVNKPGPVALVVPTRIMEAISNAGGFRDFANQKDIVILRGTERKHFNYKEVIKGKKPEQNIFLEPGDFIIVR
jgi:polysaccharide export outer membrane protein